eukprot:s1947_g2.t1
MGQSHGGHAIQVPHQEEEDDDSTSDEEMVCVDALSDCSHHQLLLQVIQGRPPHEEEPTLRSPCTSEWDGEDIGPRTVLLHVYDLEGFTAANGGMNFMVTKMSLGGAFHAGVEVYCNEWSYGKRGITCDAPRTVEGHIYRCSLPLGSTNLTPSQVASVLEQLLQVWRGDDYDLLSHNCCSFAAAFCHLLGVGDSFPKWIDRFARSIGHFTKGAHEVGVVVQEGVEKWAKQVVSIVMQQKEELLAGEDGRRLVVPGLGTVIQVNGNSVGLVQQNAPATQRVLEAPPLQLSKVLTSREVAPRPALRRRHPVFEPGTRVEYHDSLNGWIETEVVHFDANTGLYSLKCKPQVHPSKIRDLVFALGEEVQYLSQTLNIWVMAKVTQIEHGYYILNIRPGGTTKDRLRKKDVVEPEGRLPRGSVSLPSCAFPNLEEEARGCLSQCSINCIPAQPLGP